MVEIQIKDSSTEPKPVERKTRSKLRTVCLALVSMGIGFLGILIILEIVFRFCPVPDHFPSPPVNEENPISRFASNRTGTWSRGWNFSIVNTYHYNNYGFINNQDYDPKAKTPLVAVIGDSYVEALMVPYEETLQGRLAAHVGSTGRVYSFAGSGTPLSQYLAWTKYVRDEFKPDGFVYLIISNDFDESLAKYKNMLGCHHYHNTENGYELRVRPYHPTWFGDFIRSHSALLRYLLINLELPGSLKQRFAKKQEYVSNVSATVSEERLEDSKEITKLILDELPENAGVDPSRILFLVSGMRPNLYTDEGLEKAKGSYWDQMRNFFMEEAIKRGYEMIDMQPILIEHNRRTGDRFEFPTDGHWNGIAHGLAAQATIHSKLYATIFESSSPEPTPQETPH